MRYRDFGVALLLSSLEDDWLFEVSLGPLVARKHDELISLTLGLRRTDLIINRLVLYAVNRGALTA